MIDTLTSLRGQVRGEVIAWGDPRYPAARGDLLYNRRSPDRHPSVIVRARDERDVQATVRYAATHGLTVSPRGSGHNWSGIAMQSGIVLDLSGLTGLTVDPDACTAEAGPALDNRTMARRLAEHRLAFPLGHCGHVALSGYLLGGGLGWNSERWGLGCHNVIGIEVVTADGQLRYASEQENPDLFWAARGGGPAFFGVVTRYRLALHALPRAITTANRLYPANRVRELQSWVLAAKRELPDNLEFTIVVMAAPAEIPNTGEQVALATATVFADSKAEAEATVSRLAELAPDGALQAETLPTGFEDLYLTFDRVLPRGKRFAVDSFWAAAPSADFVAAISEPLARAPSSQSLVVAVVVPPSQAEAAPCPDTAFSMSGRGFGLIYAVWDEPAADEENIGWLRGATDSLAPQMIGHYVGEADLARPGWLQACYAPEAWARLSSLRERWDPKGVFRRPELFPAEINRAIPA